MFLRFVVSDRHAASTQPMGIFQAAYRLRDRGKLDILDEIAHARIVGWFEGHLAIPTRFSRSRRAQAHPKAICWFKSEAIEHIRRVRLLATMLERYTGMIRILRTKKPGYVVYEDRHQLAAVPFRDTAMPSPGRG